MKLTIQRLKQLIKEELRESSTMNTDELRYHKAAIDVIKKELKNGTDEVELKKNIAEFFYESEPYYDAIVCHLIEIGEITEEKIVGLDSNRKCP